MTRRAYEYSYEDNEWNAKVVTESNLGTYYGFRDFQNGAYGFSYQTFLAPVDYFIREPNGGIFEIGHQNGRFDSSQYVVDQWYVKSKVS